MNHSHRKPPVMAILVVPVVVAVVLTLFAWPSARMEPRDLPIGVAGAPAAAGARAAARRERRRLRGAPLRGRGRRSRGHRGSRGLRRVRGHAGRREGAERVGRQPGGGPAARARRERGREPGPPAVEDVVVPAPRGAALASSVLPLVIAGILTGALAALLASSGAPAGRAASRRIGALRPRGDRDRPGLARRGRGGLGGQRRRPEPHRPGDRLDGDRPLRRCSARAARCWAPSPWSSWATRSRARVRSRAAAQPAGGIGQLLPPGAGANLLRSTGFFDGAAAGGHVAVLGAWALAGLALVLISDLRHTRPARARVTSDRAFTSG